MTRSDRPGVALLLVDVINDLEFDGADALFEHALPMTDELVKLKARVRQAGVPTIYVNDNFGRWRSDFRALVERVVDGNLRGTPIARRLAPDDEDYFVLKPRHSGFFSTSLEVLLMHLQVYALIITGLQSDNCVYATAADAYLRGYRIVVPHDTCASERVEFHRAALDQMSRVLKADTPAASEVELQELIAHQGRRLTGVGG